MARYNAATEEQGAPRADPPRVLLARRERDRSTFAPVFLGRVVLVGGILTPGRFGARGRRRRALAPRFLGADAARADAASLLGTRSARAEEHRASRLGAAMDG
jgi:hypothetical protein